MCVSKFGQIIFGALAACAIGLTLGSMFTPGWRKIEADLQNGTIETISTGIFSFSCSNATGHAVNGSTTEFNLREFNLDSKIEDCRKWFENQPTFEKVVIALMFGALLFSTAAFVLNVLTFFCCACGQGWAHRPLPSASSVAALCLFAALIVFYMQNNDKINTDISTTFHIDLEKIKENNVNYSFYLGLGALVCNLANVVLGSIIVATAEKCL